jgi:proteasome lid subunit RPN8/RPN11
VKRLILPQSLAAQLEAEARQAFPRECCGLLEGVWDGDSAELIHLWPAPNLATAPDRFEIAPGAHFAALKAARNRHHAILGCYHSHPNGSAVPSPRDLAGAAEDNFIWLIAATTGAAVELAAYVFSSEGFGKIGLVTGADLVTSSLKRPN